MTETEQLAQLLEERHEGLSQLLFLSRRQIELIEHGDLGTLLKVLAAKQQLLTTIQDVERRLDPFRDQQPDERQWANPESREKCSQLADSSNRLLGEIFQLEQQSAGGLQQRKDEAARRLQTLHTAHEARGAYLATPHVESYRQLDLTTDT